MKHALKNFLSLTVLMGTAAFAADSSRAVAPYLNFRSQSENAARELVGWSNYINKTNEESHYGSFSVTPEYTRSFKSNSLAESLFGCFFFQNCNKLFISGSNVTVRDPKDILADWLYLPSRYEGNITLAPRIENALVDLDLYWGMDKWAQGLYFRIHAPLTWTKWNLNATFKTTVEGSLVEDGYTNLTSAEQFFCSKGVMVSTTTDTTIINPLKSARFCGCSCDNGKDLTRLADIQADLGWNFIREPNYHLGLFVRAVAPTGNRPEGTWLFEPVVGNGHHWELGGGITGSALFWRAQEENIHVGLSVDANITHLFNALQGRVFDLKGLPLSRYMPGYKSNLPEVSPLANLTATTINSSFAVQADVVAMVNFTWKNWTTDLGYNFWALTRENLKCSTWSNNCFAKGIIQNGVIFSDGIDNNWTFDRGSNINEYNPPIGYNPILTTDDIDYDGARTKGMSHKLFVHGAYNWVDREIVPFIGLGGEVEFGRTSDCCKPACESTCSIPASYASLSQWGIWLKGGCSF